MRIPTTIFQSCVCVWTLSSVMGVALAAEPVDELPNLTAGVVPIIAYKAHDPFANDQLTSVSHVSYVIRVKNQTDDPVIAESLVLIIDRIIEISGADISDRIRVKGADGHMADGRPYFHIPVGEKKDLAPYAESESITLELDNPDYLRFYPPTVQVRGEKRVSSKSVQELVETLVNKGVLTTDEAAQALESSSAPE
ncbi:MAG: hypothetical protein NPIRA02_19590 [Nitrospirales bacterium]|nr:MAG: hypothetical protein NPIRA02_19590 [Nitrospirales bacterium]